jgi:hypothetical protein
MTTPNQHRARKYLKDALDNFSDDTPPEKTIEILLECSKLADEDLAECRSNQQKQKVWAALIAAVELFVQSYGGGGAAIHTLREALTNTSLLRPGDHGLTSTAMSNTHTIDKEWVRACTIALIDEYPKYRKETYKDAVHLLGGSKDAIVKMRENYRAKKIGGLTLSNLVDTAKGMIKEFEYKSLSDFLPPKPLGRA